MTLRLMTVVDNNDDELENFSPWRLSSVSLILEIVISTCDMESGSARFGHVDENISIFVFLQRNKTTISELLEAK